MNLRPSHPVGLSLDDAARLVSAIRADGAPLPDTLVTGVTLRGQDAQPGDLFAALPGARSHGARYAADAVARGAVAVLTDPDGMAELTTAADLGVPVLVHPAPRAVLGDAGGRRLRRSVAAGARHRRDRHVGQDHHHLSGRGGPARRRPRRRADRHRRRPDRRTRPAERADHAGGARPAGAAGGDGRAGRRHRRDGGVQPRADPRPRRRRLLRRRRLHQPVPRPPRLPLHDGGVLRCQGAAVRSGLADSRRPAGDLRRRRLRAGRWPRRAERPVTVSATGIADWTVEDIRSVADGVQEFVAVDPAGVHHGLQIGLPGRYNVANCLLAVRLLDAVGVSPEQAAPGLRAATVPGRLEKVDRGQPFLALVDYAHKPGALRAVLETLRLAVHRPAGRGVRRGRQPRPGQAGADGPGGRRAGRPGRGDRRQPPRRGSRHDPGRGARREPAGSGAEVVEIGDRRAAIDHAVGWARPGDIVLIAGKGHEAGQTSQGQTRPFDDRDELAAALAALAARESARDRPDAGPDRRHRRRPALPNLSREEAAAITGDGHRRVRLAGGGGRGVCSWRCPGRAPTATTSRRRPWRPVPWRCWPPARSACPRSSSTRWVPKAAAASPACWNTTPTGPVPRCSPRWRSWPRRWPTSWSPAV